MQVSPCFCGSIYLLSIWHHFCSFFNKSSLTATQLIQFRSTHQKRHPNTERPRLRILCLTDGRDFLLMARKYCQSIHIRYIYISLVHILLSRGLFFFFFFFSFSFSLSLSLFFFFFSTHMHTRCQSYRERARQLVCRTQLGAEGFGGSLYRPHWPDGGLRSDVQTDLSSFTSSNC